MNIDGLLKRYLGEKGALPVIEMFDSESIHAVYKDIVNTLKMQPDIELGILQTLSYCFQELCPFTCLSREYEKARKRRSEQNGSVNKRTTWFISHLVVPFAVSGLFCLDYLHCLLKGESLRILPVLKMSGWFRLWKGTGSGKVPTRCEKPRSTMRMSFLNKELPCIRKRFPIRKRSLR